MKSIAEEIEASVVAVTKDWAEQRKREERQASAIGQRRMRLVRFRQNLSIKDAAAVVMEKAYLKASDNGKLPAKPRQIMYAARPELLAMTDKEVLNDVYFTQQLLPDYIEAHPNVLTGTSSGTHAALLASLTLASKSSSAPSRFVNI
jgi:hypothetical protein